MAPQDVECPVDGCEEDLDPRGLHSHLMNVHDLEKEERDELVEDAEEAEPEITDFLDGDESVDEAAVKGFSGKFHYTEDQVREAIQAVDDEKKSIVQGTEQLFRAMDPTGKSQEDRLLEIAEKCEELHGPPGEPRGDEGE